MTKTEEQQSSDMVERVAADIVRDVAELPGDTPPDDPEAMIVTCDELSIICERHLTDLLEACHHAELVEALRRSRSLIGVRIGPESSASIGKLCDDIDALFAKAPANTGGDA